MFQFFIYLCIHLFIYFICTIFRLLTYHKWNYHDQKIHEVMIKQMFLLGRRSSGGDQVLCKSTDVTTRYIGLTGNSFNVTS